MSPLARQTLPDGLGLDVGSTTVKLVAARGGTIVHRAYRRHRGLCLEEARGLLREAEQVVGPGLPRFLTGSVGAALAQPLNARWIHEVHAVAAAVRLGAPRARTVIELGGQDAKMIHLDDAGGLTSEMNERCAAGTGATLDRCLHRLGLDAAALTSLVATGERLPAVSAKCGVFAEADLVNLLKTGQPRERVLLALLDSVVRGNLAVLARGRPLLPTVVLLGGPHAFVPALAALWRQHLGARWLERGLAVPDEDAVIVPPDAALYAAIGALAAAQTLGGGVGGRRALGKRRAERPSLVANGAPPRGTTPAPPPARPVALGARLALGLDAGSTTLKAVVLDEDDLPVATAYRRSTGSPFEDAQTLLRELGKRLGDRVERITAFGVTGYAAGLLGPVLGADAAPVETLAHARAAQRFVPDVDVVCDVGGQDIKVLLLEPRGPGTEGVRGVRGFHLSQQCAAGNGALLEAAASELGVSLERWADVAGTARRAPEFSVGCAVFLDTERVTAQRDGYQPAEILAGMAAVLPRNVWENVAAGAALPSLGRTFVLSGGVQRNAAVVKAQLDYFAAQHPAARVVVHPFPGEAGAVGAALVAREACAGKPTGFVGFTRALALSFDARSDDTTRCRRCASQCARTVVAATARGGERFELLTGQGCERGSTGAAPVPFRRPRTAPRGLNLVSAEDARLFALPSRVKVVSSAGRRLRLAVPRVLAMYRAAPLFLGYFTALGVPREGLVVSEPTSEELWRRSAGRGTVDACYPAKVALAHVADLLAQRARRPFDAIFFPVLTHAVTPVTGCADTAACPVVAGTPLVTRMAFAAGPTDLLPDGTRLLTPTLLLTQPEQLRAALYDAMKQLVPSLTFAEHSAALEEAVEVQRRFEERLERVGTAAMARAKEQRRCAVVLLGRPYHVDPGLNHALGAELAAQGRTALSVRALPRHSAQQVMSCGTPFDLSDEAPFLTNSGDGEKLTGARVIAAHSHLVGLEVSSFKCGQDASLYGAVARIAGAGGKPFLALHDLDETGPRASLRLRLHTFLDAVERFERATWGAKA